MPQQPKRGEVDYDAIAAQYGGRDYAPALPSTQLSGWMSLPGKQPKVDYDAIAAQYGGRDITPPPVTRRDFDAIASELGGRDLTPSYLDSAMQGRSPFEQAVVEQSAPQTQRVVPAWEPPPVPQPPTLETPYDTLQGQVREGFRAAVPLATAAADVTKVGLSLAGQGAGYFVDKARDPAEVDFGKLLHPSKIADETWNAAADVVLGSITTTIPALAPGAVVGLMTAPVTAAISLGLIAASDPAGQKLTEWAGGTPAQQRFAGAVLQAATLLGGVRYVHKAINASASRLAARGRAARAAADEAAKPTVITPDENVIDVNPVRPISGLLGGDVAALPPGPPPAPPRAPGGVPVAPIGGLPAAPARVAEAGQPPPVATTPVPPASNSRPLPGGTQSRLRVLGYSEEAIGQMSLEEANSRLAERRVSDQGPPGEERRLLPAEQVRADLRAQPGLVPSPATINQAIADAGKKPTAVFFGYQVDETGQNPEPQYTLVGGPSDGSYAGLATLERMGVTVPETPTFEAWQANGVSPEMQAVADKFFPSTETVGEPHALETGQPPIRDQVEPPRTDEVGQIPPEAGRGDRPVEREAAPEGAWKGPEDVAPAPLPPTGTQTYRVGDIVRLTKPGLDGPVKIAGTVKSIKPDGKLEVRSQQDGYFVIDPSEVLPPPGADQTPNPFDGMSDEDVKLLQSRGTPTSRTRAAHELKRRADSPAAGPGLLPTSPARSTIPGEVNAPTQSPSGVVSGREGPQYGRPAKGRVLTPAERADRARTRAAARAVSRAEADQYEQDDLDDLIAHAQTRGFSGDPDTLRADLAERLDDFRELDAADRASGANGLTLLRAIAKAGGIEVRAETGQQGEIRWLKEFQDTQSSKSRKNLKARDIMVSGQVRGVRGVFHDAPRKTNARGVRVGGLSLDDMLLDLRQEPRFSYIQTINDLTEAIRAAATGKDDTANAMSLVASYLDNELDRRGLGRVDDALETAGGDTSFDPAALEAQIDVLDTGEEQRRLPAAGSVRDKNIETPSFEAPFSLSGGADTTPREVDADLFGADLDELRGVKEEAGDYRRSEPASVFYSALTKAVEALPQAKGAPGQMLAMIEKAKGVKAEEL